MTMRFLRRRAAFTLIELLVCLGIGLILLSILIPVVLRHREQALRVQCVSHLRAIRDGLAAYAADNGSLYPRVRFDESAGYTAYTGADAADPFADDSAVAPNDVTASLWLLVRGDYVKDVGVFICPSTRDRPDSLTNAAGQPVERSARSNFRSERHLGYSYASPFSAAPWYRLNIDNPSNFAVMADMNPGHTEGYDVAGVDPKADPFDMARANSANHGGAGQNVLYAQGEVVFKHSPFVGVEQDNIYTVLSTSVLVEGESVSGYDARGFFGKNHGPAHAGDSYLVPAAGDGEQAAGR